MKGTFCPRDSHIIAKLAGASSLVALSINHPEIDNCPISPTLRKGLCYSRISIEYQQQMTVGQKLNGLLNIILSE